MIRAAILALVVVFSPAIALADITGPSRVIDGDTIEAAGERIRLHSVAAPEMDAPGGWATAKMMRHIVAG